LVSALHSVLSCLGTGGVLLVLCTIVWLFTVVPCDILVPLPCFAVLGRRDDVSLAMLSGALYVCDTVPAFQILDSSVLLVCRLFGFLCRSLRKCRTSPGCLTSSLFFANWITSIISSIGPKSWPSFRRCWANFDLLYKLV